MNPIDWSALREAEPGCPPRLTLERLRAGELPGAAKDSTAAHVAGCAACSAWLTERARGFSAEPGVDPRRMLAAIRRGAEDGAGAQPGGPRRWRWLAIPVAAAAAAAIFLFARAPSDEDAAAVRLKGGAALHVFRASGEAVSGDPFRAGEPLELRIDLPEEAQVAIVGLDPRGKLYPVWPASGGQKLLAGLGQRVPGAVALDPDTGAETLFLVTCAVASSGLPPPRSAAAPDCQSAGPNRAPTCPAGCASTPFVLRRAP